MNSWFSSGYDSWSCYVGKDKFLCVDKEYEVIDHEEIVFYVVKLEEHEKVCRDLGSSATLGEAFSLAAREWNKLCS